VNHEQGIRTIHDHQILDANRGHYATIAMNIDIAAVHEDGIADNARLSLSSAGSIHAWRPGADVAPAHVGWHNATSLERSMTA
jgi:hypothetical protein